MALINISQLTFSYDSSFENIFHNVSFQIDTNWKLGFIGRNGRGKTTFLKLLMGEYEYKGTISADIEFDYFPFSIEDDLTINIIEEMLPNIEQWQIYKEFSLLEIPDETLYQMFFTLSKGEQTKIMLAILFLKEHHFLLIDEPTNHLDMNGRRVVSEYLNKKNGFILISHDRTFLDGCIDHVLSINKANIEVQKGNYSTWKQNKDYQDQYELNENQRLKKDIKRLNEAAKRTTQWSDDVESTKKGQRISGLRPDRGFIGHKSAKMMKRSKTLEKRRNDQLNEKEKLLKNIEEAESLAIHPLKFHSSQMLYVDHLNIVYDRPIIQDLSFNVYDGERVALIGKNGSGKSSIIKLLLGQEIPHSGTIFIKNQLKISYVSQDTAFLKGNLKEYAQNIGIDESLFKAILRKLDFSRIQFEKNMEEFSAGQKKKVLIASSLCQQAHLYIWDEPLNYIDVLSRIQIENLILEYQPTMIFVEHDAAFTDKIATKRIQLG
ncbi:ribosomal protection-like ABC-F family protein [Beduini massiliensis]|uniref:ribosomal protection-like ABC-F family protein n=1 Tax=Beduini massiliensis TaxID=1585974 RepID=UPI00059AB1E6|nr:ABC-F type ribosomal protection protein [Beduini massiliensis]